MKTFMPLRPTRRRSDPGKAQRSTSEVSEGENIGEAKVIVLLLGMEVKEVAHVHVGFTKLVGLALG